MMDGMPILIATVAETDLDDLLPLVRGYCDFYGVQPSDEALRRLSWSLLEDPLAEGIQLIARDEGRHALGFATIYWSWSTFSASRIAVMNDLFVDPDARGRGVGEALIAACRVKAADRGATELSWQTAKDNVTAQSLYDRMGAERSEWLDYSLSV